MKSFILAALVAVSAATSATSEAHTYAAISFSRWTGRTGVSWGQPTLWQAQTTAQSWCGVNDCQVFVWTTNGCIALAQGWNGALGWAFGGNQWQAQNTAMSYCGYNCRIIAQACTF